jgi:hypothetical protein
MKRKQPQGFHGSPRGERLLRARRACLVDDASCRGREETIPDTAGEAFPEDLQPKGQFGFDED